MVKCCKNRPVPVRSYPRFRRNRTEIVREHCRGLPKSKT